MAFLDDGNKNDDDDDDDDDDGDCDGDQVDTPDVCSGRVHTRTHLIHNANTALCHDPRIFFDANSATTNIPMKKTIIKEDTSVHALLNPVN